MSQPLTALGHHARIDALPPAEAAALRAALEALEALGAGRGQGQGTHDGATPGWSLVSPAGAGASGATVRLPAAAAEAVLELLSRLASGDGVELSSAQTWLNTSQAARLAGISATYLRNLTDAGEIPVSYRGSHRRFLSADITAWVAAREASRAADASAAAEPADAPAPEAGRGTRPGRAPSGTGTSGEK